MLLSYLAGFSKESGCCGTVCIFRKQDKVILIVYGYQGSWWTCQGLHLVICFTFQEHTQEIIFIFFFYWFFSFRDSYLECGILFLYPELSSICMYQLFMEVSLDCSPWHVKMEFWNCMQIPLKVNITHLQWRILVIHKLKVIYLSFSNCFFNSLV